jgi:heme/copper-type cytochrome/quinol oxidase subunit 2
MSIREQVAQASIDASIASTASKTTYAGATMTLGGWLVTSEAAVLVGIVLGVAGFVVNLIYRHRADRREQTEHDERMRALRNQTPEGA